jgi:hypothetical protein
MTSLLEELIFRGLLQRAALAYVALLFTALHLLFILGVGGAVFTELGSAAFGRGFDQYADPGILKSRLCALCGKIVGTSDRLPWW